MRYFLAKLGTMLISVMLLMWGVSLFTNDNIGPGIIIILLSLFVSAVVDLYPEPKIRKFKLKDKHVHEIISEAQKDSLLRDVEFIEVDRAEEIVEEVMNWDFDEALVAQYAIQSKFPNMAVGREIHL